MKINKTIIISILFLIFLSISVSAETNYTGLGGYNQDYEQGFGNFNEDFTPLTSPAVQPVASLLTPLVADLDGDGTNEIIVLDGTSLIFYQNTTLDILDGVTLTGLGSQPTMIIFDIDGDGYKEVIVGSDTDSIFIVKYNGTSTNIMTTLNLGADANGGDVILKCGEIEECVVVFNGYDSSGYNTLRDINIRMFNSTAFKTTNLVLDSHNGFGAINNHANFCLPRIRNIQYKDYDNDGTTEYIFSYAEVVASASSQGTESVLINYVYYNTTHLVKEKSIRKTENLFSGGYPFTCSSGDAGGKIWDKYFTSPLVFNLNGISSDGLETVIGMNENTNEFRMFSYKADGSAFDDYPEVLQADGQIISNVFEANIFPDSSTQDFCVLGYDPDSIEIDLVCASHSSGEFFQTYEWDYDITGIDNITDTYMSEQYIVHSAQHSQTSFEGLNPTEIVSSIGIFEVEFADNELHLIYENDKHPSALLSIDYEQNGLEDLLAQSSTNLWYIDDGFTNSPAYISSYVINPCISQAWKLNTSVGISITPIDINGDDVSARATLYYGSAFENSSGWSSNVTSGTTIPFTFTADSLITAGTIRLEARDTENPTDIDIVDLTFSVGTNGVEFGDCSTDVSISAPDDELTEQEANEEEVKDTIQDTLLGCDENGENCLLNTGWLTLIGFLVIILSVWGGIETGKNLGLDSSHAFYIGLLMGLLAFVFTIWIGWLSYWMLLVMILFSVMILAFVFRDKLIGNSGGI